MTAGCTSDGGGSEPATDATSSTPPAAAPVPFPAATTRVPQGYRLVQCSDLRGVPGNTGLAVRLVVPSEYVAAERQGGACRFSSSRFGREFGVSFGPMDTLADEKEREVDPFEDEGGDDSVSDISYDADVPVFGELTGERLAYFCFCDGQDLDEWTVQSHGVRLTWTTPHGKDRRTQERAAVTSSVALVRSHRATCDSHGQTVTFRPPVPQTESMDFASGRCHLYLRPGRASLLRYAAITARPRQSLADQARLLADRPLVTRVRYEPGVTRLGGRVADRLTWTVVRDKVGQYGAPAGTWRFVSVGTPDLQATWSAHPRQWRTEADDAHAFFDSVRLRR